MLLMAWWTELLWVRWDAAMQGRDRKPKLHLCLCRSGGEESGCQKSRREGGYEEGGEEEVGRSIS